MKYYPDPDRHTRDKAEVVQDMPTYAIQKELEQLFRIRTCIHPI